MRLREISTTVVACALFFTIGASVCAGSRALFMASQTEGKPVLKSKRFRMIANAKKGESAHSLILEWSLKNVSRKDVSFRDTHILRDYSMVIKDHEGHAVRPTERGQNIIFASGWVSHRDLVTLHPGDQVKKQIVITDIYDIKRGEVYTIYIKRQLSLDKGVTFEVVKSNVVQAKVD